MHAPGAKENVLQFMPGLLLISMHFFMMHFRGVIFTLITAKFQYLRILQRYYSTIEVCR